MSFGIATALSNGQVSVLAVVVEPIVEILLSVGLGGFMGLLLHWVERFFHSRSKRMSLSVAFVMLTVGLSMLEFQIGPVHCGFSLLLVCMMTGTIFCNVCPHLRGTDGACGRLDDAPEHSVLRHFRRGA